jgi:hypothetical protein
VALALGLALGYLVTLRAAARYDLDGALVRDAALWSLPEAIIAARIGYVAGTPDHYLLAPIRVLHFWDGGFAFGAGLVGGLLALWRFARRRRLSFARLAAAALPGLLVGQAWAAAAGALEAVAGPNTAQGANGPALGLALAWPLGLLVAYAVLAPRAPTVGVVAGAGLALVALGQLLLAGLAGPAGTGGGLGLLAWATIALTAAGSALYHLSSHRSQVGER